MTEPRYLSIRQAAQVVGVCRRTIYNWINAGLIDVKRTPTGRPRISEPSLWGVKRPVENKQ